MSTNYDKDAKRDRELICQGCGHGNRDGKLVRFSDGNVYCWACGHLNTDEGNGEPIKKAEWKPQVYKEIPQLVIDDYYSHEHFFGHFIANTFGWDIATAALELYNTGRDPRSGRTAFVFTDIDQRHRYIKSVQYKPNGKRDKDQVPYARFRGKDGYKACLFGEHLLKDNTKVINLVESEKSAIIASIVYPDQLWLATGGSNGLTMDKAQHLRGLSVRKWVDCDAAGRKTGRDEYILNQFNATLTVKDPDKSRNDGADIADIILESI